MDNLTGYCCGICKTAVEKGDDFPFCDHCQQFFHYECAQVEEGTKDDSWKCPTCAAEMEVTKVIVKFDDLEKTLLEMEAEAKHQEERILAEQQLHKRRLELQLKTQQRQQEAERQMLALEQQLMEQQLVAQKQFQDQQKKNKEAFEAKIVELKGAKPKKPKEKKEKKGDKKKQADQSKAGPSGESTPFGRPGTSVVKLKPKPTPPTPVASVEESSEDPDTDSAGEESGTGDVGDDSGTEDTGEQTSSSDEEQKEVPPKHRRGPTKAQLTARQFLAKKLPIFTGRCEEWPMFISSYETSNLACGFSDVENLARLQDSIREPALSNVRSLLLLPEKVPAAIETLRMLYGRPEQLLNTLLIKVRKADSPRSDRLESFIYFGVVVQQLVDHLEATHLNDHLVNPLLIRELVEKLPAGSKLEWIRFKKQKKYVSLQTFAEFLSDIVADASEATLFTEPQLLLQQQSRGNAKKAGPKAHKGHLHTHVVAEQYFYF